MSFFQEKNIVEVKQEYTTFLIDILTPLIYEGITSIYNDSLEIEKKLIEKSKLNADIKPQGILKIFQSCLKEVPNYNKNILDGETERIKNASKCYDWFDDLVRASVKSHILLLACTSNKNCKPFDNKYYEDINITDFVHKCYVESAKVFYNNPELLWHELKPIKVKRNQKIVIEKIRDSITSAIRKLLPMKLILDEFLSNTNYTNKVELTEEHYDTIKNKVLNELRDHKLKGGSLNEEHDIYGENIRTSENGFEEVDNDKREVISDSNMDLLKDQISKLNNNIKKNIRTENSSNNSHHSDNSHHSPHSYISSDSHKSSNNNSYYDSSNNSVSTYSSNKSKSSNENYKTNNNKANFFAKY